MLTTVLATVFVFGLLIFFHELGHFAAAKAVKMRVTEFAIGFGQKIISRQSGETTYSVRLIPLGGFNRIAGMDPDDEPDSRNFNAKPVWARMLVIAAGSLMNFLLPILLFVIVFTTAGIEKPSDAPIIGTVLPDRPAARAGVLPGDHVLSVNGKKIETWRQFVETIQKNAGNELEIEFARGKTQQLIKIVPEYDARANRGIIGVVPQTFTYWPGFGEAIVLAAKQTYAVALNMLSGIIQMLSGRMAAEVAGPIGVAQMAGQVAQMGFVPLLQFAAFLSINLGLINLLPVPVLDGGHLVTLAVEGIRGKPLSRENMHYIQMLGLTLLVLLMIVATYKDISRLRLF